ncbi:MAG TPA: RraA family protein [Ilumatobacter sp.]|nr:RraA family protein [Ilumatobacter sp.]
MTYSPDVIRRYQLLYTSLVSDCVEALGLGPRALAPGLVPFHSDSLRVVVGPAHTCQIQRTDERVEIDGLLAMVDATPEGSVVVVATDTDVGGAVWGGLMTAGVQQRGAVGAVADGGIRDLHQVVPLDFAVFAAYRSPLDIRGRGEVVGHGVPVVCRGVPIEPDDLVVADANGVVIVPRAAVDAVLALCEDRVRKEILTQEELEAGGSAVDVYARHEAF